MRIYSKGIYQGQYSVTKGVASDVQTSPPAISVDITASDPTNTSRIRPRPDELIWNGQGYSKTYTSAKHTQLEYEYDTSTRKDWSTYYHYWRSSSNVCGNSSLSASVPVDPMNRLLGKLRNNVANISTMLGEYRDTSNMVADVGTKILKSVKSAKRGNIVGALKTLGSIVPTRVTRKGKTARIGIDYPAAWLQYKLALSPLLSDMSSLVETLSGKLRRPALPVQRVSTSQRTWLHSHKEVSRNRFTTVKSERTRQLIAYVQIDNTQLQALSDHGLTNPLSLLWELTWLSFVVDYVYNVSEWLQAMDQPYLFTRSVCYETQRERTTVESIAVRDAGLGSGSGTDVRLFGTPRSTYEKRSTSRTVRELAAVTPQWKPSGGFQRLVTLSALAVSIGRK